MTATTKCDMARLFLQMQFDMANMSAMITKFSPGSKVSVMEYGGKLLIRYVVEDFGRTVIVCNEDEHNAALTEKRKPNGIGFPRADVKVCGKSG
jgi:hypothetical protein